MLNKDEFFKKIMVISDLIATGYYQIAKMRLMEIGMNSTMSNALVDNWKAGNFPSKEEFSEIYDKVVAEMYKAQYDSLNLDKRPDVKITEDKIADLSNMLNSDLDIIDIINKI